MTLFHGTPIADPSGQNRNDNQNDHYEESLKDGSLPVDPQGDQANNDNELTYPSVKGYAIEETATVPITYNKNQEIQGEDRHENEQDQEAEVEVFHESSALDFDDAKEFVEENHYKTVITTDNTWVDPDTGKAHLFEKLPREATRLI